MKCPRRREIGPSHLPVDDLWRPDGTCSYCGSLEPDAFMAMAAGGVELEPTDKPYKVYAGSSKFYFQHLSEDQRRAFFDLMQENRLRMGYPGHFYVLPFFVTRP